MGDKEDPDRVIFEFSTHIAVPKWQPKTAYKEYDHIHHHHHHHHPCLSSTITYTHSTNPSQ
jgi:hypothetical protein